MARKYGPIAGPYMGGGHYTPGIHWRADKAGKIAVPAGPDAPIERPEPEGDGRLGGSLRDPRTAARMAEVEEALKPKRWRPGGGQ